LALADFVADADRIPDVKSPIRQLLTRFAETVIGWP